MRKGTYIRLTLTLEEGAVLVNMVRRALKTTRMSTATDELGALHMQHLLGKLEGHYNEARARRAKVLGMKRGEDG